MPRKQYGVEDLEKALLDTKVADTAYAALVSASNLLLRCGERKLALASLELAGALNRSQLALLEARKKSLGPTDNIEPSPDSHV